MSTFINHVIDLNSSKTSYKNENWYKRSRNCILLQTVNEHCNATIRYLEIFVRSSYQS